MSKISIIYHIIPYYTKLARDRIQNRKLIIQIYNGIGSGINKWMQCLLGFNPATLQINTLSHHNILTIKEFMLTSV